MDACDRLLKDLQTPYDSRREQSPILCRGMRFSRTEDLKVAVEEFYASQGKGVKHGKGGSRQREFRCSGSMYKEGTREHVGCLSVVRATKQANREWRISSMDTSHKNCTGVKRKVSVITAGRIASEIVATMPNVTGKELKAAIESRTGGTLSLRSAHRAKCAALAGGRMTLKESYSCLRSFLSMLAVKSPGTITDFELFSVDAIALEGNGVAITLSCKDSENEVVLAATAIVQEGDPDCYEYLLRNCKRHPEMREFITSPETTSFSAGDPDALAALAAETPEVQHRWCMEHIISEIPAVSADCNLKLFDAARAPTFESFAECMDMVRAIEPATFEAMMSIPLPCWTHHASLGSTVILDQVTSHATELTSGVLDAQGRKLPIVELLERIARSTSRQFAERQMHEPGIRHEYTKFAAHTYEQESFWGAGLKAYPVGYSRYVVKDPKCPTRSNSVMMTFRDQGGSAHCSCTCAFPARFRIPCRHVFAAAKVIARVEDCTQFLDKDYGAKRFRKICSDGAFRIECPSLSELERDWWIKPPRGMGDRSPQPRQTSPRAKSPVSVAKSRSSGASPFKLPACVGGFPNVQFPASTAFVKSPFLSPVVASTSTDILGEAAALERDLALDASLMGLAGVSAALIDDGTQWL